MSFPGLVDAATPVTGAAVPAKTGTHAKQSAFGDFASLVHDAQHRDGQELPDAQVAAAESQDVPDSSDAAVADDAPRGGVGRQDVSTEKTQPFANLAGFFRSMRNQPVEEGSAETEHASGRKPQAEIAIGAPVAVSDDDESLNATVIIATPDAQMPQPTQMLTMLPDVQIEQDLTAVAEVHEAPIAPALPQAVALVSASPDQADASSEVAMAPAMTKAVSDHAPTAAMAAAPRDTDAPAFTVIAAQAIADADVTKAATPVAAAPLTPLAVEIQAQINNARQAQAPEADAPAAAPSSTPVAKVPVANAAALGIEGGMPTAASLPVAEAAANVDATSPTAPPLYARPRATGFVRDGATTTADAPKIKFSTTANDLIAPKADRQAAGPRTMPSMFVMPHAAVSPMAAAASLVTPTSVSVVETQVRDQIVQSLRVQILQGGGEATIELNPEVLGKVQVAVKVDRGSVTATVQAATAQVREWVTTHRDELSQTLAQQGLRLDKLEVAEAPKEQPARDQAREQRQAPRESGRQRRDDRARDTDTFELQDPQETV